MNRINGQQTTEEIVDSLESPDEPIDYKFESFLTEEAIIELLSLLAINNEFFTLNKGRIKPEYIKDETYRELFKLIDKYHDRYDVLPTKTILHQEIDRLDIEPVKELTLHAEADVMYRLEPGLETMEYYQDQLDHYVGTRAMHESISNSLDIALKKGANAAWDYLDQYRERARSVGQRVKLRSWNEVCEIADKQQEDWWIQDWAEFGTLLMLSGLPFCGKSLIVADLIGAIASKTPWAGMDVKEVPVILADFENKESIVVKRIKRSLQDKMDYNLSFLHALDVSNFPLPATNQSFKQAMNMIGRKGVLIIDTMRSAMAGTVDEKSAEEMQIALMQYRKLARDTGWLVLLLHHNSKGSNTYSGSTAIAGVVDYMWNCISDKQALITTVSLESRGDVILPLKFAYSLETQRLIFAGTGRASESVNKYFDLLLTLPRSEDAAVKASNIEYGQFCGATLYNHLKWLVDNSYVNRKNSKYWLSETGLEIVASSLYPEV